MKRYGMMGGTFNPIHLAHLYIAYEAKETLNLDKVIFMVAGNPPHKTSKFPLNLVPSIVVTSSYIGKDSNQPSFCRWRKTVLQKLLISTPAQHL